uniref:Protein CASP n=1 Tax=Rhizophora mucronata TaxID=61149 RepID=A0A2P2M2D5_RHIMU
MWEVQVVLGSKGLFPMAQMAQSRHTIETGEYQEMQPNSVEKCKSASILVTQNEAATAKCDSIPETQLLVSLIPFLSKV